MEADRTETTNLIDRHPALAADLAALHDQWARRCGVLPWAELEERRKSMG
jgi:arylsulfatase